VVLVRHIEIASLLRNTISSEIKAFKKGGRKMCQSHVILILNQAADPGMQFDGM
jgi:hypothetical protein